MKSRLVTNVGVACIVAGLLPSLGTASSFQGLGDLTGGIFESMAWGISADGTTVVGDSASGLGREAFRWTISSGMVGLGDLSGGAFFSRALGVSRDGSVVVGEGHSVPPCSSCSGTEAFVWTARGGMSGLGTLRNDPESVSWAVSADGATIVGQSKSSGASVTPFSEAFFRTGADGLNGMEDLPGNSNELGLPGSVARDVSADGSVIVGVGDTDLGSEAFRWTANNGMIGLGDLPGGDFFSRARGVTNDGAVVVGFSQSGLGQEAFRWTEATGMIGLGDLPGSFFSSRASDVSADGSIIVGGGRSEIGDEAFIWDEANGMQNLAQVLVDSGIDLTGWTLRAATGISDDGSMIVGFGINPDGNTEGWIADTATVPVPPSVYLFGSGLIGLIRLARRNRNQQLFRRVQLNQ